MTPSADNHDRALDAARRLVEDGVAPTAREVAGAAGISLSTYHRSVTSHAELLDEAGYTAEPSTPDRLLDAASELIREVGFANLRVDDVADRAGVSRATFYRHFGDRSAVLQALAERRAPLASLDAVLDHLAGDADPGDLAEAFTALAPNLLAARGLLRAVLSEPAIEDADGGPAREAIIAMFQGLGGHVAALMERGELRRIDPMVATIALVGPLLAYTLTRPDLWFGAGDAREPAEVMAELVGLWQRAMRPGP